MKSLFHIVMVCFFLICSGAYAEPSQVDAALIDRLISAIESSPDTFIRNGSEYSAHDAAVHLREKYANSRSHLSSVEEFIKRVASRSMMTGKPYMLLRPDGSRIEVQAWLEQELVKLRSESSK